MLRIVLEDIKIRKKGYSTKKKQKIIGELIWCILLVLLLKFFLNMGKESFTFLGNWFYCFGAICIVWADILNEIIPYQLPKLFHYLPMDQKEKEDYLKTVLGLKMGLGFGVICFLNIWCFISIHESIFALFLGFFVEMEVTFFVLLFGIRSLSEHNTYNAYFINNPNKKVQNYAAISSSIFFLSGIVFFSYIVPESFRWFWLYELCNILLLVYSLYFIKKMMKIIYPVFISFAIDYEQTEECIEYEKSN